MIPMKKKLIAGNWKMNGSLTANDALLAALRAGLAAQAPGCDVAVAVPAPYLAQVQALVADTAIALAAQDVSQHEAGAYTGEASAAMLRDFGVRYTLVGHSERRQYHGEGDALVARKFQAAKHAGLTKGLTPLGQMKEAGNAVEARLIAGPFANALDAAKFCAQVQPAGTACAPSVYVGQPLAP